MFRELAGRFPSVELHGPADPMALAAIERDLGSPVPPALRALLLETDGMDGNHMNVVWPAARILEANREFRTFPDFRELYMPFDTLMFFGDNGGGDQFAFVRTPRRDDEVFVWDHETDSRDCIAGSLEQYLSDALGSEGDWYR
ncbi:SMI1/KNR4 family protein [Streptomyces mesophilus]|nr:SMI1/KNR4 family protein [Streptomyces mesophilus]